MPRLDGQKLERHRTKRTRARWRRLKDAWRATRQAEQEMIQEGIYSSQTSFRGRRNSGLTERLSRHYNKGSQKQEQ